MDLDRIERILQEVKELEQHGPNYDIGHLRKADDLERRAKAERDAFRAHVDSLGRVSDVASPEPSFGGRGIFAAVKSAGFDIAERPAVVFDSSRILRKDSSFPTTTTEELPNVRGPFAGLTFDARYVYPSLPQAALGEDLAVSEYYESSPPSVTGSVERDPLDTSPKAAVEVSFAHTAEKARQVAITLLDIPSQIVQSYPAFQGLLNERMQRQLDEALDLHVISQIDAARPDSGSEGVTTIEILRFAVGAMRAKGVNPTIVAMNPDDSTDLDLTTAGADNLPLFSLRTTGDSSPLWGLRVVEAKNVDAGSAYLIDPQVLGVLYTGSTSFLADPYTGMANNTINFRLELNALMHIRNADGAYIAVLNNS